MIKYKIRMILSIMIAAILLLYTVMPLLSRAENEELNIKLTKIEINGEYQINVTGSSPSKIIAITYINERKTLLDFNNNAEAVVAYFEGEKATAINIKEEKYIDGLIDATRNTSYTVYVRNEDGEIKLSYITVKDKDSIVLELKNIDNKQISINATSTVNLVAVKVAKVTNVKEITNFVNEKNLLQTPIINAEITYPISEAGIYQVYVEDENKNKRIQTIEIIEEISKEVPITIEFYKVKNDNSTIYAVAKNTAREINIAKYIISDEKQTLKSVKENGSDAIFVKGKEIVIDITSSNILEKKYISVYVKDEKDYEKMQGIAIKNIPLIDDIPEVEVPVQQIIEEPIQQVIEEPTQQVIEEPAQQVIEEPTQQVVEEPVQQVIEEPTQQVIEEPAKQVVEEPAKQVVEEPTKQVIEEPAKQVIEEPKIDDVQLIQDETEIKTQYPQTGGSNLFVIAGIIISIGVAVYSYIKMKQCK